MRTRRGVAVVGVFPPPTGGVSVSSLHQAQALRAAGLLVFEADFRHLLRCSRVVLVDRPEVLVLNANGRRSACMCSLMMRLSGGTTILFVHATALANYLAGDRLGGRLLTRALDRAVLIWKNHAAVGLPDRLQRRATVVALPVSVPTPVDLDVDQFCVVTAAYRMAKIYSLELCVAAVQCLRREDHRWRLRIIAYGSGQVVPEINFTNIDGVEVLSEMPHERLLSCIASAGVFLRATTTDGDSVLVREALALGTPVVASNVVPRPPDVVLTDLTLDSLCSALRAAQRRARNPSKDDSFVSHVSSLLAP